MTPQEKDRIECAIRHIQTAVDIDPWAAEIAVEAMKAQLSKEDTTLGVQKTCITCKHYPPESKWPCIDCDMRNPADRWEPQELSKNSTELDKENGELHPTCTGSEELKQEVKNSTESSLTQKALDTIKPMRVIDANKLLRDIEKYHLSDGKFQHWVQIQPTIEPETCEDAVSRNAIIQKLNTMDRYVSEELILCDTDKKFPKNEVFIVDDVYEEIVEKLPSAQPEPCDDAVSREAAIDAALSAFSRGLLASPDIRKLPSVQPEPQWIPCSERLPDMWDERYLVSLAWGGIGVMEYKSTGFHNYGSFAPVPIESITAWMPLPEPYREERRTDE